MSAFDKDFCPPKISTTSMQNFKEQAPLGLATVIKTISVDSRPAAQLTKKENKSGIELFF